METEPHEGTHLSPMGVGFSSLIFDWSHQEQYHTKTRQGAVDTPRSPSGNLLSFMFFLGARPGKGFEVEVSTPDLNWGFDLGD